MKKIMRRLFYEKIPRKINCRSPTIYGLTGEVMDWKDALAELLPKEALAEPQRGS